MKQILFVFGLAALTLVGCDSNSKCGPGECSGPDSDLAVEVVGTYQNAFDMEEVITDASWSFMEIVSFDNEKNVAITQNAADDMFNPSKFNRLVWTEPKSDGTFYYCTEVFGKDTAADAESDTTHADASDPATTGCGGAFAWTKMTPKK